MFISHWRLAGRYLMAHSSHHLQSNDQSSLIIEVGGIPRYEFRMLFDERKERDEALRRLKNSGLTIKKLERLTGINRGVIQRA